MQTMSPNNEITKQEHFSLLYVLIKVAYKRLKIDKNRYMRQKYSRWKFKNRAVRNSKIEPLEVRIHIFMQTMSPNNEITKQEHFSLLYVLIKVAYKRLKIDKNRYMRQ